MGFAAIALVSLCLAGRAAAAGEAPWVGTTDIGLPCRGNSGVGPLDYMNGADRASDLFGLVEEYHFTRDIETLTGNNILGNLDYTLRGVPNHHRALFAMMSYQERSEYERARKRDSYPTIECYLYRAKNFAPRDAYIDVLLGILRHRQDQRELAMKHYQAAEASGSDLPILHYNMGLLLAEMGDLDAAMQAAERAYAAGITLPGLRNKLASLGRPMN